MEIVLLGHMGRDEAVAERLQEHKLHVLGQWANPGLVDKAEATGGHFYTVDSITNTTLIADIVQSIEPDMFLTNFDDALAAGVVDVINQRAKDKRMPDVLTPCPDRAAARVEWDKFYLRELVQEIAPHYNPANFMAETPEAADNAITHFEAAHTEIALKPRNLTGGKGVKVQGKHFDTYQEARQYAQQVLAAADQAGIEVQEKLDGHEFTLQLFTDGTTLAKAPVTYDYPYREDEDRGPGTGGMGTFSMKDGLLPFVDQGDYDEALALMDKLLEHLRARDIDYRGILYPTFFKTKDGLKIVEVNARGGDPELINIVDLMDDDVDLAEVLKLVARGELAHDSVRYKKMASAMVYLVSPDYGYRRGSSFDFEMDPTTAAQHGCRIRFAATEQIGKNHYRTVGSSRSVGVSSQAETPWQARENIHDYIQAGFTRPMPLAFRNQVAEQDYIHHLK